MTLTMARIAVGLTVTGRLWPMLVLPCLVSAVSASDAMRLGVSSATVAADPRDQNKTQIAVRLDDESRRSYGGFTARHTSECAVFLLNGRVASEAARILMPITGGYAVFFPITMNQAGQIAQQLSQHLATLSVEIAPCALSSQVGDGVESMGHQEGTRRLARNAAHGVAIIQP